MREGGIERERERESERRGREMRKIGEILHIHFGATHNFYELLF